MYQTPSNDLYNISEHHRIESRSVFPEQAIIKTAVWRQSYLGKQKYLTYFSILCSPSGLAHSWV
jgi:hypothetical protein